MLLIDFLDLKYKIKQFRQSSKKTIITIKTNGLNDHDVLAILVSSGQDAAAN
jgi:hypothetical protein